jgi:hypothetical protein
LRLKSGHALLLVVHSVPLNFAPRALPGLISDSNAAIIHVLTGPRIKRLMQERNQHRSYSRLSKKTTRQTKQVSGMHDANKTFNANDILNPK